MWNHANLVEKEKHVATLPRPHRLLLGSLYKRDPDGKKGCGIEQIKPLTKYLHFHTLCDSIQSQGKATLSLVRPQTKGPYKFPHPPSKSQEVMAQYLAN